MKVDPVDKILASKIEKSKKYSKEPERIWFESFRAKFRGDHKTYTVSFNKEGLVCTCPFFKKRKVCSHTIAIKKILGEMLGD